MIPQQCGLVSGDGDSVFHSPVRTWLCVASSTLSQGQAGLQGETGWGYVTRLTQGAMFPGSQKSQIWKMWRCTKPEKREYNESGESTSFVLNVRDEISLHSSYRWTNENDQTSKKK